MLVPHHDQHRALIQLTAVFIPRTPNIAQHIAHPPNPEREPQTYLRYWNDMPVVSRLFSILDESIPIEDKISQRSVNTSIGGQWPPRRNLLHHHLAKHILNGCPSSQVRLRSCYSIKDQPDVPIKEQP